MTPYYYPTTTLIVGNAFEALKPVSAALARLCPIEIIESTAEASARLFKDFGDAHLAKNIVQPMDGGDIGLEVNHGQRAVLIRPPQIKFLRTHSQQSNRISVTALVAPELDQDTLTFLSSIKNGPARRLLVTSKREFISAIRAANDRLVDAIVFVDEPNLEVNLGEQIDRLQREYFERSTTKLYVMLANGTTAFIEDPAIADLVSGLVQSMRAAEYYVSSEPPGVLLIDQSGVCSFVLIYHSDLRRAHIEIAALQNAPDALIQRLTHSNAVANFPTPNGFFDSAHANDWQRYVWAGESLSGTSSWTFALIRNSQAAGHLFDRFRPASEVE